MSVRDFLGHMYRDQHPILHYGLIYLAQTIGTTNIVALRSLNLLGLGMVGATLAYAHRHKAISPAQIMVVGVVFMSSPLSLSYFSELRAYFPLYSASISISELWWMLVQRIDQDRSLPPTMIVAWGAGWRYS